MDLMEEDIRWVNAMLVISRIFLSHYLNDLSWWGSNAIIGECRSAEEVLEVSGNRKTCKTVIWRTEQRIKGVEYDYLVAARSSFFLIQLKECRAKEITSYIWPASWFYIREMHEGSHSFQAKRLQWLTMK